MVKLSLITLCLTTALILTGIKAWGDNYAPDLLELSGDTALALEPEGELSFAAGGTVEFWVSPGWQQEVDYAPVIIASRSTDGLNFAVALSAAKDQLFVYAGDKSAAIDFAFSNSDMHHVVVASLDDVSKVLIDGILIASLDFAFLPGDSETLWVGGLNHNEALFKGALAQLRVWDTALIPQELVDYAMADAQSHPSLASLRVSSEFSARRLTLIPIADVTLERDLE